MSLDFLKTDKSIENETNYEGSGGGVLESGLYDFVIDMAYFGVSQGGANSLNLSMKTADGKTLRQTLWITSGTAKGCKNYYENTKTKKRHYLPGFNQANAICMLSLNKEISDVATEQKVIKLYDFKLKKEVPQEMPVLMELIGAQITCGVLKQIVDKNVKNDAGVYVPNGETRDENEIDKCFRTSDGMSVPELRAGEKEPAYRTKWDATNTGVTRDRTEAKKGASSSASTATATPAGAPAETESMFDD